MLTHSHLCPSRLSCSLALLSTFTHSTSPALLLVCTLSNCVSSHLVTLSGTLPSLACLRHICTHTRAHAHTLKKKHTSHVGYYLLKLVISALISHVSSFVSVFFLGSFADVDLLLSCRVATVHDDLFDLICGECVPVM